MAKITEVKPPSLKKKKSASGISHVSKSEPEKPIERTSKSKGKAKDTTAAAEKVTQDASVTTKAKGDKAEKKGQKVETVKPEAQPEKRVKRRKVEEKDSGEEEEPHTSNATSTKRSDDKTKPSAASSKKTKKVAKALSPAPSPSQSDAEQDQNEDDEEDNSDKESVHLFGFSTDDDDGDSSDDDDMVDDAPALDVGKLPTIAKDDATVKRKLDKAKRKPTEDRGVIYLGRIPHGFYEDQMRAYFSQFGEVTRLRLSRNKRTGKSKHYAFIEFDSSAVAEIVAETMDNYLLMGHILTCKVIPKDKVHPELWIGANRKWRPVPRSRVARVQHNKPRTEDEQKKAEHRLLKRQAQKKRKLAEAGIDYDFDAVAYKRKPKPTEA